ncbi:MAG: heme-copper oxidase subunit III [Euryarchaeota archaeon TMED141]|nr:MAG: heme-copper oxidase subunit III [Euryarchaeota archaeon TMED141]
MSGGHAHVENSVWMRSLLMAGLFLTIGVVAYGVLAVGIAGTSEDAGLNGEYHDAKDAYYAAKADYESIKADGGDTTEAKALKESLHDEYVSTHLNYLTFAVAGNTVLVMMIVYSAFIGFGGFVNSLKPDADHGDHDDHGHHGSSSPIVLAFGVMLFMIGFPRFANGAEGMLYGLEFELMDMAMSTTGLVFVVLGIANWWQEDLPFDGHGEQIATATDDMVPFRGQHIRKVGIWIFLMSEVMVFASFFSSYLRMRTGWCTDWAIKSGVEACAGVEEGSVVTASDLIRGDLATLAPGAINTFALIISSYTIVLALKAAKNTNWEVSSNPLMAKLMPTRKAAVRNYLIATLALGSLFIVLKLIEWSHLIAEGFTLATQQGSIFYIATGAHGLHVFVGLLVMLYLIFKADTVGFDEENGQGIEYFGLYWHFVDLAWVVIFPAFYLY